VSGFVGGGGAGIGALIASVIYYITSSVFPEAAFAAWGWRFMFFAGILSSVLGLFIFNALEESPLWQQFDRSKVSERAPLRTLFSQPHLNTFLVNLLITVGGGVGYYLTAGYMPTFLTPRQPRPY
jgi:MFS family permease